MVTVPSYFTGRGEDKIHIPIIINVAHGTIFNFSNTTTHKNTTIMTKIGDKTRHQHNAATRTCPDLTTRHSTTPAHFQTCRVAPFTPQMSGESKCRLGMRNLQHPNTTDTHFASVTPRNEVENGNEKVTVFQHYQHPLSFSHFKKLSGEWKWERNCIPTLDTHFASATKNPSGKSKCNLEMS